MKKTLPKKHKKEIICFAREMESLASTREIFIDAKARIPLKISWLSDNTLNVETTNLTKDYILKKSASFNEIKKINRKIKKFCKKTVKWGKKHFKDGDWLWRKVLWGYCPAIGDTFDPNEVIWK